MGSEHPITTTAVVNGGGAAAPVMVIPSVSYTGNLPSTTEAEQGFQAEKLFRVLQRRRRVLIAAMVLVSSAGMGWLAYQRLVNPVYEGSFSMLITDPVSPTTGGVRQDGAEEGLAIGAVALNRSGQDLPTLMKVLESPLVLQPVFNQLTQSWGERGLPTIEVEQGVALRGERPAGILTVKVSGRDQAMLRRAMELTKETYLGWSLRQRRERLQEAVKFLDEQAPALESKAASIQEDVERFRLQNRLLAPESDAEATRSQVDVLRAQLNSQQAELSRLERLRQDVAAGRLVTSDFSSESSSGGSQAGSIGGATGGGETSISLTVPNQAELQELAKIDSQLADARSRFVAGTPLLKQLESARATLLPRIQNKQLEAIEAALMQYRSGIAGTQRQINSLESRFNNQPALLRQFAELEQKLRLAEGNRESYLKAREQFQLEIAQNTAPWKIINPGKVGSSPIKPAVGPGIAQALLFGVLAGIGAALLRERFDHVFHNPTEVIDELRETLLGHVPYIALFEGVREDKRFLLESLDKSGTDRTSAYQRFHYQESFRNMATSLRFLSTDRPIRSIAISSSVPAEGKSLVVVLLAKTLSELGQRVLLIDADMRKPQLHHRLGLDNVTGLSNLLTDENNSANDWSSCVQSVPNHASWDVITAGRTPPDPPRLLSSVKMAQLVETIAKSERYDLIIYDTPPALGLADASLVAEHLDGLILLVSLSRVDRDLPKEAMRRIRQTGAPVLGVITNSSHTGTTESGNDVYDFSYRYRYGYGYGGYGYGGYGSYGYANDPLLTYTYYRKNKSQVATGNDSEEAKNPLLRSIESILPSKRNLRSWMRGINRWLDG